MAATAEIEGLVAYTDRETADEGGVRILRASTLGDEALVGLLTPIMYRTVGDPANIVQVGTIEGLTLVPPSYEGGIGSVQITGELNLDAIEAAGGDAITSRLLNSEAVDVSLAVANPEITEEDGKQIIGGAWTVQSIMLDDSSPWPGCNVRATTFHLSQGT